MSAPLTRVAFADRMDRVLRDNPQTTLSEEVCLELAEAARVAIFGRVSAATSAVDDLMVGTRRGRVAYGAVEVWQPVPSWEAAQLRLAAAPAGSMFLTLIPRVGQIGHTMLAYHSADSGVVWYDFRLRGGVVVGTVRPWPVDSPVAARAVLLGLAGTAIAAPFGSFRESGSTVGSVTERPVDNRFAGGGVESETFNPLRNLPADAGVLVRGRYATLGIDEIIVPLASGPDGVARAEALGLRVFAADGTRAPIPIIEVRTGDSPIQVLPAEYERVSADVYFREHADIMRRLERVTRWTTLAEVFPAPLYAVDDSVTAVEVGPSFVPGTVHDQFSFGVEPAYLWEFQRLVLQSARTGDYLWMPDLWHLKGSREFALDVTALFLGARGGPALLDALIAGELDAVNPQLAVDAVSVAGHLGAYYTHVVGLLPHRHIPMVKNRVRMLSRTWLHASKLALTDQVQEFLDEFRPVIEGMAEAAILENGAGVLNAEAIGEVFHDLRPNRERRRSAVHLERVQRQRSVAQSRPDHRPAGGFRADA